MKLRVGDKIKVISGKDKGKTGKIMKVYKDRNLVVAEGIHVVKRHVKPGAVSKEGGIISIERPVAVSNVILVDSQSGNPTKIGFSLIKGKKYRINKKTKEALTTEVSKKAK